MLSIVCGMTDEASLHFPTLNLGWKSKIGKEIN